MMTHRGSVSLLATSLALFLAFTAAGSNVGGPFPERGDNLGDRAITAGAGVRKKQATIYKKGWIDFNKNGVKDVYEDPTRSVDERVEDLLK